MTLSLSLRNYSVSFVAFMMQRLDDRWTKKIKHVILFGSVARGTATTESDVDILVDTEATGKNANALKASIIRLKEEFLISYEGLRFKSKRIYNEINIVLGDLDNWEDMKRSINNSGIVLFGKYSTTFRKGTNQYMIFYWSAIGKNRGAFLNKLYGYKSGKKRYPGLLDLKSTKIGKSAVLVPAEDSDKFLNIFEKYAVEYRALEVFR